MNCLSVGNEKKNSTFKQKHLYYDIFVYATLMIHLFWYTMQKGQKYVQS